MVVPLRLIVPVLEVFKIEDARLSCMFMVQPQLFEAYMAKKANSRELQILRSTLFCAPLSTIGQRTSDKEEWLINNSGNPMALEAFNKRMGERLQKAVWRRITGQP